MRSLLLFALVLVGTAVVADDASAFCKRKKMAPVVVADPCCDSAVGYSGGLAYGSSYGPAYGNTYGQTYGQPAYGSGYGQPVYGNTYGHGYGQGGMFRPLGGVPFIGPR